MKEKVLYIGNYLNDKIKTYRGIPSSNIAGSNRMLRISNALLNTRFSPIIISPADSFCAFSNNKFFINNLICSESNIPIIFLPKINIKYLSLIFTPFICIIYIYSLKKKYLINKIIIYNYSFTYLFIAIFIYIFTRVEIYSDIEDIPTINSDDFFSGNLKFLLLNIINFCLMRIIQILCIGNILPTVNFINYLPKNKPYILISGCLTVPVNNIYSPSKYESLIIIFSGKIEREFGVVEFSKSLEILDNSLAAKNITVNVCGFGDMLSWLSNNLLDLKNINVNFYGQVSNKKYLEILSHSNLCIGLQDPLGKYGKTRTPSKVYEFMSYGKAVITTNVGDLSVIPKDSIFICDPFNPKKLSEIITLLSQNIAELSSVGLNAHRYAELNFSYISAGKKMSNFFSSSGIIADNT